MQLRFLCKLDPKTLTLQEVGGKKLSWVHVFRKGQWEHPRYGTLKFTDEIFAGFIKNFNDRVRKIDLAIDTEHETEKGACGWMRQLEDVVTPDVNRPQPGLWAQVEWTPRGLQLVAEGSFKYLSGDFDYEWTDDESGKVYKNVLFGAALTNRPFIKGMSPINLSEFMDELEKEGSVRDAFQLAEDLLKLKEGKGAMKTDAEILACKDEKELNAEELARKAILLKKKDLSERAVKVGLKEDATEEAVVAAEKSHALKERAKNCGLKEDATEAEVVAKEKQLKDSYTARCVHVGLTEPVESVALEQAEKELKERAKKIKLAETASLAEVKEAERLAEQIGNENEQAVKIAGALGLPANATLAQIYDAASKFIAGVQRKIEGSARTMSERAKAVGLKEDATEGEVILKEKELRDSAIKQEIETLLKSDIPVIEKRLSEMKAQSADALTVKLLEETIVSKKALRDANIKSAKEAVELKLKEHFRAGKITVKERGYFSAILCSQIDSGAITIKLSEKDKDGKDVETAKMLSELIDAMLTERPAIVELAEIAAKELKEPPKEPSKDLNEEEAQSIGSRIAKKATGTSKTAKKLAERAKAAGLKEGATLAEIEKAEKEKK